VKQNWKKDRSKAAKHARLMQKRPELYAALYGAAPEKREGPPPDPRAGKTRNSERD
jgi:hypothetical protein